MILLFLSLLLHEKGHFEGDRTGVPLGGRFDILAPLLSQELKRLALFEQVRCGTIGFAENLSGFLEGESRRELLKRLDVAGED